jgi:hypothetical protein
MKQSKLIPKISTTKHVKIIGEAMCSHAAAHVYNCIFQSRPSSRDFDETQEMPAVANAGTLQAALEEGNFNCILSCL